MRRISRRMNNIGEIQKCRDSSSTAGRYRCPNHTRSGITVVTINGAEEKRIPRTHTFFVMLAARMRKKVEAMNTLQLARWWPMCSFQVDRTSSIWVIPPYSNMQNSEPVNIICIRASSTVRKPGKATTTHEARKFISCSVSQVPSDTYQDQPVPGLNPAAIHI